MNKCHVNILGMSLLCLSSLIVATDTGIEAVVAHDLQAKSVPARLFCKNSGAMIGRVELLLNCGADVFIPNEHDTTLLDRAFIHYPTLSGKGSSNDRFIKSCSEKAHILDLLDNSGAPRDGRPTYTSNKSARCWRCVGLAMQKYGISSPK